MKRYVKAFVLVFILVLVGIACGTTFTAEPIKPNASDISESKTEANYVEGDVIVIAKITDDTDLSLMSEKNAEIFVRQKANGLAQTVNGQANPFITISRNKNHIMTVIHCDDKTTQELITYFKSRSDIISAEPNYTMTLQGSATPNDPYYSYLWGLTKINAPTAWQYTTGSDSVTAVVIDSGLDYEHEDLKDNLGRWIATEDEPNYSKAAVVRTLCRPTTTERLPVFGGFNLSTYNKKSSLSAKNEYMFTTLGDSGATGHGTHCSGIVGAVGNNKKGITGICQQGSLLGISILSVNNSGTLTTDTFSSIGFLAAIDHIAKQVEKGLNIKVVSLSFGGFTADVGQGFYYYDALSTLTSKGILVCAAAGNYGYDLDAYFEQTKSQVTGKGQEFVPAAYANEVKFDNFKNNIISVGNINSKSALASDSDYSPTRVTLMAPGVSIKSCAPAFVINNSNNLVVSNGGAGYVDKSGTSQATPLVAGTCALVWSAFPNKAASEIRSIVVNNASKTLLSKCQYGVLDAGAAMKAAFDSWGISLDKKEVSVDLDAAEKTKLTATCKEAAVINWSSDNEAVATVDQTGEITAISKGMATITATNSAAGCSASCSVTVYKELEPTLNATALLLNPSESETLKATVIDGSSVDWSSSDSGIATVDQSGKVVAVLEGSAKIIVTSRKGETVNCAVTVADPAKPEAPAVDQNLNIPAEIDKEAVVDAVTDPSTVPGFSGSTEKRSDGMLYVKEATAKEIVKKACAADETVTTVTSLPIFTADLSQNAKNIGAVSINLKGSIILDTADKVESMDLRKLTGTTASLKYTRILDPGKAKDGTFIVLDNMGKVATGKISSSKTYQIVMFIQDNGAYDLDKTDNIIVDPAVLVNISGNTISVSPNALSIKKGASGNLTAITSDGSTVTWGSSNTGVATVSASGNKATVKGVAKGNAVITATAPSGIKATCNVSVTDGSGGGDEGGGGGCNAGFAAFALLISMPLILKKRK